ncbi:MAG: outer membrane lipoprotein carrier protein LolA [Vicingaceae bacterium]
MKKGILITIGLAFIGVNLTLAQDAKSILDQLSKKAASYESMKASFSYEMMNEAEGINEKQSGSIISQGDKYNLEIAGQKIISDGKTIWTVIEEANEVQIDNVPEEGEMEEEYISPTKILTLWEEGFKYKYDSEQDLAGTAVHVINLFPEDPSEKSFHTIKLFIDKGKMEVKQIGIKGKDGTDFIYKINDFETNLDVPASTFTFNNPEYDVIDLR